MATPPVGDLIAMTAAQDPKQTLAQRGEMGKIQENRQNVKNNQVSLVFFTKTKLGASKEAKHATTESTKIFLYRQAHPDNFFVSLFLGYHPVPAPLFPFFGYTPPLLLPDTSGRLSGVLHADSHL